MQSHTYACNMCIILSLGRHWQCRRIDRNGSHKPVSILRDARERGHGGDIAPCPFKKGATGVEVPFHNSIIDQCFLSFFGFVHP